jgi:hypothetical protein
VRTVFGGGLIDQASRDSIESGALCFAFLHWTGAKPWIDLNLPRRVIGTADPGFGRGGLQLRCHWPPHGTHVAVHRLRQLRIHFIRNRHDIRQQQAEIHSTQILLPRSQVGAF